MDLTEKGKRRPPVRNKEDRDKNSREPVGEWAEGRVCERNE